MVRRGQAGADPATVSNKKKMDHMMGLKGKESPESWEEVKRQWARDAQAGKPILR